MEARSSPRRPRTALAERAFNARLRMKHLELFRNVCELQTLRRAAEASSMTQPAATKLVRELEDMFGHALFQRDRRGMKLTRNGEVVRRHIDILLADIANMRGEVDLFARGATGRIRLGIIPSLSSDLLARAVARTLEAWPEVRFSMQEGATTELLAALARNDLDLTFGRVIDTREARTLRVMDVYTESFAIVCAAGHPLARRRKVPWTELAGERWVLPTGGSPLRDLAENLFIRNGVLRPAVAVESSSFEKMRFVIAHTALLGILPRSIALRARGAGDLAQLRPEQDADFAPISLIFRKDFDQPPLIDAFARVVRDTAVDLKLAQPISAMK